MKEIKMSILAIILIFIGGGVVGFGVDEIFFPKHVTNIQYIEQTQSQNQWQVQGQITIVGAREMKSVQIDIDGYTNITYTSITNGVTN